MQLDEHLLLENKTYAEGARSGAFSSGYKQYSPLVDYSNHHDC